MRGSILTALLLIATPALALNEGLQCVPYARALSGIEIRGDAHTWWGQAAGKYERGNQPRVGAVMAFIPYGKMRLGHVATVSKIIDARTVLISHSNWSTINGSRGHIEQNVRAVDTSPNNDWSRVRVWYSPLGELGTTEWPVHGFIYPNKVRSDSDVHFAVDTLTGGRASGKPIQGTWNAFAVQPDKKDQSKKDQGKPVKIAALANPAKNQSDKSGFTLSNSFLKDIDKKAAKEIAANKGRKIAKAGR